MKRIHLNIFKYLQRHLEGSSLDCSSTLVGILKFEAFNINSLNPKLHYCYCTVNKVVCFVRVVHLFVELNVLCLNELISFDMKFILPLAIP